MELFASPHNVDHVFEMDNALRFFADGGKTPQRLRHPGRHGDYHALAFDPDNPAYLLLGTDGGIYESWDDSASWRFVQNLPVTQFYKLAVDYDTPFYNIYGGTQDNSTQGGPSRTDNITGIRNQRLVYHGIRGRPSTGRGLQQPRHRLFRMAAGQPGTF